MIKSFNFNKTLSREEYCDFILTDLDNILSSISAAKKPSELIAVKDQIDWAWRYFEKLERIEIDFKDEVIPDES